MQSPSYHMVWNKREWTCKCFNWFLQSPSIYPQLS
jgi:hypothetical protein